MTTRHTFAAVLTEVRRIAAGRYSALELQATCHEHGDPPTIEWKGYVDGPGWTSGRDPGAVFGGHTDAAAMLVELEAMMTAWQPPPEPLSAPISDEIEAIGDPTEVL